MESAEEGQKEIADMLDNANLEEIFDNIKKLANDGNKDVTKSIKMIFYGSLPSHSNSSVRILETFKFVLKLFQTVDLQLPIVMEIISVLRTEIDSCHTSLLLKIAEYFVSQITDYEGSNTHWLEIFPAVLNSLSERDSIVYQGTDMSGKALKTHIIQTLCEMDLKPHSVMQIVPGLNDMDLTNDEIKLLVEMMLSTLQELKYLELPPYVYQLLHFQAKVHRKVVLRGIVLFFIDEDRKMCNSEESGDTIDKSKFQQFRQIQGSVIVMIRLKCRLDRDLGMEFISILRSLQCTPTMALSPFAFSIAMSLSSLHRFEESVLSLLKKIVLHSFQHKEKCHHSLWVRNLLPNDLDVVELVKSAIADSSHGWDHISQGLIKFGFILLDTFGPKLICGRAPNYSKPHVPTVSEQACLLGSIVLRRTFWGHHTVRSEVFKQILDKIVTKSNSPVSHYINVLSGTVQGDPQLLLEILSKVIEILDYLPFLPHANAVGILKALTPLLKISMPLKDALMLVLRKSLFHRDIEPRKIAITGYLTILKKINARGKMALSQSQCSFGSQSSLSTSILSAHSDSASATYSRSMCLEIMGILKRTFIQQASIKQLLYEGLYDIVVKKPDLANIVLELLLSQFEKFLCDSNDSDFPIDITLCFSVDKDDFKLVEPIAHLITSIHLILFEIKNITIDDDEDVNIEQSPQIILEKAMKSVATELCKENVEFDVSKSNDTDDGPSPYKSELSSLLLSIYESMMEYYFMDSHDFSVDDCGKILSLFSKHKKIVDGLQNKKNKGSKSKKPLLQSCHCNVTIRFVATIIEVLFCDDNTSHQEGLSILRSYNIFVKFILSICNEKLTLYKNIGKSDGFSENMEKTQGYMCSIAKIFLKTYSSGHLDKFPSLEPVEIFPSLVDGLNLMFAYISSTGTENYDKFLEGLSSSLPSASLTPSLKVLKRFQKLTIDALADTDDDKNLKEVIPLLSIMENLCTVPAVAKEDMYEWTKQLCKEQTFDDITLSKKFLSLCLALSHQCNNRMAFMLDIAVNIHFHLGDIDSDINVREAQTLFKIVDAQTSASLILILIHHIEQVLNELEWTLKSFKSDTFVQKGSAVPTVNENVNKENILCEMFLDLIKLFHEIMQSAMPVGNTANELLKIITTLYKCFSTLCKYYISLYDQKIGHLSPLFEKMVKLSGTQLTVHVYAFITYIQSVEAENNRGKKSKNIKAVKDIKTIPPLVFVIELYEKHLIALSKKTKKNLMSHMKLSTSRDFRINSAAVTVVMEENAEDENDLSSVLSTVTLSDDTPSSSQAGPSNKKRQADQVLGKTSKVRKNK